MKKHLDAAFRLAGALIIYTAFAASALGISLDDVAKDFRPISGIVVMTQGQEVIIDLDAANGVRPGDVFSVLASGKQIIHPATQKVLGNLEEVKAILKVTRLKTGFAFTRPLHGAESVKRGDPIRSYYGLPAVFWDYSNEGRPFFNQIQSALPDLKWQDYESAQRSKPAKITPPTSSSGALTFILTADKLEVRDPEFAVIKFYPSPSAASQSGMGVPAPEAATPMTAVLKPSSPTATPETVQPVFSKTQTLVNLPEASLAADFVHQESRLLMASTDGSRIYVYELSEGVNRVSAAELSRPGTVLALKWWKPAVGGPLYLAVTAWVDNSVKGSIWMFQKDLLQPYHNEIPHILGSFDIDRDGLPETLLAQEFDRDGFFSLRVREVIARGNDLSYEVSKVSLPRQFPVLGSAIADVDGDGRPESIYIRNKILFVYSGNRQLYKSPKEMGGSVSVLTYNSNLSSINEEPATAVFETNPLCADLDQNGIPEIIVPASERTLVGSFVPSVPDIKRSWIAVVRYQNGRYEMGTLGEKLEQPVQGLGMHEQQIMVVTTEAGSITGEGARSHLLAFFLKP